MFSKRPDLPRLLLEITWRLHISNSRLYEPLNGKYPLFKEIKEKDYNVSLPNYLLMLRVSA
jgi:hypothetical protein